MKYAFEDIMKTKRGPLHPDKMSRFFYQPLSNVFLYIFLNLKISANGVGLIMALLSIAGSILFFTMNKWLMVLGSVLFIVAMILDHTDGDVARKTGIYSKKGIYLDHIHHMCEEMFPFIGLGLYSGNLLAGMIISGALLFINYLRATVFWFLNKEGYYDSKFRKLPLVLIYGDFFKIWHFVILIGLILNFQLYVVYLALVWTLIRTIPKLIIFYRECGRYDQGH